MAYLEPSQISKIELFVKIATVFQPITILAKSSILDAWLHVCIWEINLIDKIVNLIT